MKRLSNPAYRQKQTIHASDIAALLTQVHQTITRLHQQKIIIGDLNDTNIFFQPGSMTPFFIDVDSYQIGRFPCPVALPAFLDPALYHVSDFSRDTYFTPSSDWYAFAVLLVKSLLGVHPYGGTHPQRKMLADRASAGIAVWHTAVTYPARAYPPEILSDNLLHWLDATFTRGQRRPFPPDLLIRYAKRLKTCPQCGQEHPRARCPVCHRALPAAPTPPQTAVLYTAPPNGSIEAVTVLPNGRIAAVTRIKDTYHWLRLGLGGVTAETPLFRGSPGCRFAIFDGRYLAVNPPDKPQLLILDGKQTPPPQITLLETAAFRDTAVFAAASRHLYRIAGDWIMRGAVRHGRYLEEAIATAHRAQTWFTASPYDEAIAGCHRIFAEYRFFVQTPHGSYDLPLPPTAPGEHIAGIRLRFAPDQVAVAVRIGRQKEYRQDTYTFTLAGKWLDSQLGEEDEEDTAVHLPHPQGRISWTPQEIVFNSFPD
ncbi:MAG TPA: hypothetical protein EYP05_06210 [Piscirickettsiaceae bacterium]|nr:hypothetical protein [Piscirickettsiaceae bacterium]